LSARRRFAEALEAIKKEKGDDPASVLLALGVRLKQRADLSAGIERREAESEAFRLVDSLRNRRAPEARIALARLARSVKEPDPMLPPAAWETLAEARRELGDSAAARRLEIQGADQAEAKGEKSLAWELRYRAGATSFQAGDFASADPILTRVFRASEAGSLRAKAGLLRILARGRGLAAGQAGFSTERYVKALEEQLGEFPSDSTSGETRWLLGKARLETGDRAAAETLWKAVPRSDARGLDARLALAGLQRDQVTARQVEGETVQAKQAIADGRVYLTQLVDETREPSEVSEIELARARLELTPGVGSPDQALEACLRALKHPHPPDLDRRVRQFRVVALAQAGLYIDAEHEARAELAEGKVSDLLTLARRLDSSATAIESDTVHRRIGQIDRQILGRVTTRLDELRPEQRTEALVLQARAILFSGDPAAASAALAKIDLDPKTAGEGLLHDLADTYAQLGDHSSAIAVYRRLAGRSRPGSAPWFEARLGEAQAYQRAGQTKAARRLIEATSLLHPDLGGGSTRARFERLRASLGPG
jgi:tetratricopeptide (TPR) repeat protein